MVGAQQDGSPGTDATPPRRDDSRPIYRITDAPVALDEDRARRQRRYLWQMAIRLICFALAAGAWALHLSVWLIVGLVVAASILPYIAVIEANAGRDGRRTTQRAPGVDYAALPSDPDSSAESPGAADASGAGAATTEPPPRVVDSTATESAPTRPQSWPMDPSGGASQPTHTSDQGED